VLGDGIRLTLLAVDGGEAVFGFIPPHPGDLGGHGKDETELPMTVRPVPLASDHQGQVGGERRPRWFRHGRHR
jgi:hypothetical protein